jgi:hypothetical protein
MKFQSLDLNSLQSLEKGVEDLIIHLPFVPFELGKVMEKYI